MKKRRIFIGLPLSEAIKQQIDAWKANYQNLPVRWILPENLHITVIPPWYEKDIGAIQKKLARVTLAPLDIHLTAVRFGPIYQPRLIWAEGTAPGNLFGLQNSLEQLLKKKSEKRPYLIHLTIARFKRNSFSTFPRKVLDEGISWKETIRSFILYESHPTRKGADYKTLCLFPFRKVKK